MKSREKAAALRAAAQDIDEGKSQSSWGAVWWAFGDHVGIAYDINERFERLFAPRRYEQRTYWDDEWGDNARECGVLALLFAAAMAERGDL